MYAMRYGFTLPGDYDMAALEHRVDAAVHLTDNYPGLGLKAYLFRERGAGSPVNEYVAFYLWQDVAGMNRLLWGGGPFHRIVAYFGRPVVRHWTGAALELGPARDGLPVRASIECRLLDPDTDPAPAVEQAAAQLAEHARTEGVHTTALAVDPASWELLRFTLWTDSGEAPPDHYRVLHVSQPFLEKIPTGRQWRIL